MCTVDKVSWELLVFAQGYDPGTWRLKQGDLKFKPILVPSQKESINKPLYPKQKNVPWVYC